MTGRQSFWTWTAIALISTGGLWLSRGTAQPDKPKPRDPAELMPQKPVVYLTFDGAKEHRTKFEKTALYQSMFDSGLIDVLMKAVSGFGKQAGPAFEILKNTLAHTVDHGLSLSISAAPGKGMPTVNGIVVVHNGAKLEASLGAFVQEASKGEVKWETVRIKGRRVTMTKIPGRPPIEIGWWAEGQHLSIAVGMDAIDAAISVAAGDKNITGNALYKKYRTSKEFTVTSLGWIDVPQIVALTSKIPIPAPGRELPSTVGDMLKVLGLDNAGAIVGRTGIQGKALIEDIAWGTNGKPKGLLAIGSGKPLSLKDLPPLPKKTTYLAAGRANFPDLYEQITEIVQGVAKLGPPDAAPEVKQILDALPQMLGFDPNKDFFDAMGDIACVFCDDNFDFGIAIEVKNAEKLADSLAKITVMAERELGEQNVKSTSVKYRGRDIVTLELGGGFLNPSYVVGKKWLVIGLVPQTAKAHVLRAEGKLGTWKPSQSVLDSIAKMPKGFNSISISDPAPIYEQLLTVAPFVLGPVKAAMGRQFGPEFKWPLKVSDLPPAAQVAEPMFPNVTLGYANEKGFRSLSRQSVPSLGVSITTVPVMLALLLPAIQNAREAARRTQSRINLQSLGLALHNYHEAMGSLPSGTISNAKLAPNKRLSWMASILPFIAQRNLADALDQKNGWETKANRAGMSAAIRAFQHPSYTTSTVRVKSGNATHTLGATHYVGIAGYGKDAASNKAPLKRRGVFGYDRNVTLEKISNADGTANTMMVAEANEKSVGGWGVGGSATIRGFTKKPYVNGPDGIGYSGGPTFNVLFCDGSVRSLSNKIDPKVLEAMSTYAGGERIRFP